MEQSQHYSLLGCMQTSDVGYLGLIIIYTSVTDDQVKIVSTVHMGTLQWALREQNAACNLFLHRCTLKWSNCSRNYDLYLISTDMFIRGHAVLHRHNALSYTGGIDLLCY